MPPQRMRLVNPVHMASTDRHLQVDLEAFGERPTHGGQLHGARQAVHDQHVAVAQLYARVGHRAFLRRGAQNVLRVASASESEGPVCAVHALPCTGKGNSCVGGPRATAATVFRDMGNQQQNT